MLTGLLARNAATRPTKTAIVQAERRISYQELHNRTGGLASRLRSAGVGQGDSVAIVLPNGPEFVFAFFAVMRLKAVAMPVNPTYTTGELGRFLSEKPVRAVITDALRAPVCHDSVAHEIPVIVSGDETGSDLAAAGEPFAGDALHLFTSGSTGSTKRVLFTQRNLFAEALNFVESTGIGPDDPIICPVPLYHSYGLCIGMLDAMYTGATLVLEPQPDAPFASRCSRMLELLREEKIRVFPGVPSQFAVMADMPDDVGGAFREVAWCMSSGDLLPRRIYDKFLARTGRRIRSFYGSTEAGSVTLETGPEENVGHESVGPPLKNVSISIRKHNGSAMAPCETGEIWIQSQALPPTGYDDDAERTREVFRDGWYGSGDLGYLDARGRLVLSGRKQAVINIGSYKVDAAEVEETLLGMPGVREAAVVAVEIPHAGTMIKAVLATNAPDGVLRESEIRAYCRQRLAMFKVPRIFEFVPALPRDPMGKILRRELASAEKYVNGIRDAVTVRTLDQIHRAPPARRRALVLQLVERHVSGVLGRDAEPIPRDAGFADLGMDSFGYLELHTRLDLLFGPGLSQTFTFDHPCITAAADELVARLPTVPA